MGREVKEEEGGGGLHVGTFCVFGVCVGGGGLEEKGGVNIL